MSQVDETAPAAPEGEFETVLSLLDAINDAPDDLAIIEKVSSLRERLNGASPSIIIRQLITIGHNQGPEMGDAAETIRDLEARLAAALAVAAVVKPENGFYTLAQFVAKLHEKRGITYGWRVDYIRATQNTPDCRVVKNEEVQKWQQTHQVPDWAFDQIEKLIFQKRKGENGPAWANWEFDFLVALYEGTAVEEDGTKIDTSSATSNAVFAKHCTKRFGRDITENAIKGAIDRLRKKGRLPPRRTSKKGS